MKLYFSLKSIPELADLPPSMRRLAWHACKRHAWRRWQTWVAGGAAAGMALFLAYLTMHALFAARLHLIVRIGPLATFAAIGFLGGAVLVGVTQLLWWPVVAGQIRPALRDYAENHRRQMQEIRDHVQRDDAGSAG